MYLRLAYWWSLAVLWAGARRSPQVSYPFSRAIVDQVQEACDDKNGSA